MVVKSDTRKSNFDLVMQDFKLFAKNFLKIIDNQGDTIPFVLNKEQTEFIDTMEKFNIILKARQIGFSTLSLGLCLWNAINKPNTQYMIVSLSSESSSTLFSRLKFMNDNLPRKKYPNKFPTTTRDNRNELVLSNGARILIATAQGNNKEIGRGSTLSYVLLSEFAFYTGDQKKILTSIEQSLAKNADSKIVIETSANGTNNHYFDLFMKSWKGNTKWKPFFYNWMADAYKEQFRYEHDIAEQWYIARIKSRLSVKDLGEEEKKLYDLGANLRMLMWRIWKLTSMDLADFQQEYPSFPEEAFRSSGNTVFKQSIILERIENLIPELIKEELKLDLPDTLQKFIGKGLHVFHLPKHSIKYYGGCDTASGSGADNSTISIIDNEGIQVCTFANNKVSVYEFAEIINSLGRYYNYAFLAIERNSYGLPVIERLRQDYEYMNLYKHKTFGNNGQKKLILGWLTTDKSKAIMISDYKEQFERKLMLIHCRDTLQEMMMFIDYGGKMGNRKGANNHDDLVIASALSIQAMKANKWYV
ncbi:DNA packaging protein [Paenibacillus sp. KACC 21273]|uniref:phage terminase large subunit family protein n=1 Tax=Paenibacillus sp. KACC 21273 TaxID=3025665 RepID=UPI002365D8B3|nr:DNA packaging protein [Paenibacillus sp. KACC 21273]WDF52322.1 DNA packaging protein [Paenibacillus sp. KACC 21273]